MRELEGIFISANGDWGLGSELSQRAKKYRARASLSGTGAHGLAWNEISISSSGSRKIIFFVFFDFFCQKLLSRFLLPPIRSRENWIRKGYLCTEMILGKPRESEKLAGS